VELFRKSEKVQESRDRESAEGSENSVRIVAPAGELWGVNCEGLSEINLHSAVSYCVTILSCVAIPHRVGMSSCVGSSASWCILTNRNTHARSESPS